MRVRNIAAYFLFSSLMAFMSLPAAAADMHGNALVRDDGSLKMGGQIIDLYGIYIPLTQTTCRSFLQTRRCASEAALALDFKIQGFVYCRPMGVNPDGSLSAVCYADYTSVSMGEDLAAYLLEQGWAMALPSAPFEYHALERIARHRGFGLWGFPEWIIP